NIPRSGRIRGSRSGKTWFVVSIRRLWIKTARCVSIRKTPTALARKRANASRACRGSSTPGRRFRAEHERFRVGPWFLPGCLGLAQGDPFVARGWPPCRRHGFAIERCGRRCERICRCGCERTRASAEESIVHLRPQASSGVATDAPPLEKWPAVPSQSIVCAEDRTFNPRWSWGASRRLLGVEPIEIPGGHCPFLSRPDLLSAEL